MLMKAINDWIIEICYHNKNYSQWELVLIKNLQVQ